MKSTYLTKLTKTVLMITMGMLLSVNAWAQDTKSLSGLEEEVKKALNCSFITTDGVPDNEAYQVLDFILRDSKTFTFNLPYLRKIIISNTVKGEYTENAGQFTGITLPNTRDEKFLDYCLRHEMGHVIDHAKNARESNEWTAARKHVETKSISTYAGTNDQELFAEMVAYRTAKEYGKSLSPLPNDVEKMIDKYLYN
jgi:hypothetical protein